MSKLVNKKCAAESKNMQTVNTNSNTHISDLEKLDLHMSDQAFVNVQSVSIKKNHHPTNFPEM